MEKVAILLCTYNGEKYIGQQIESLIKQTYSNFVCYIHDDGSTDGTTEIIKKYQLENKEKIISLTYKNPVHSAAYNFMSLILNVRFENETKYIMFCDQDDIWLEDKIEQSIHSIKELEKKYSGPVLTYCDQKVVDENLNVLAESTNKYVGKTLDDDEFHKIVFRNTAAGCCMCMNYCLYELIVKVSNINAIVMHDWWVMLLATSCGHVKYLDIPLMLYRQHGMNAMGVDNNEIFKKIKKYITNFKSSMKSRKNQTELCKEQIRNLPIKYVLPEYKSDINEFMQICNKGKIYRIFFMLKKGYIKKNNLFTLLFV